MERINASDAQTAAMDRAGELPPERRVAERRTLASHPAAPVQPESAYSVAVSIRASQGWKIDGGPVPILYTDEINGQQVCRDDVFLCKTEHLAKTVPPVQQTGDVRDQLTDAERDAADFQRVCDAVADALKGNYYCGCVWSAWSVGTMSEDDFTPSEEVDEVVSEIAAAAIAACQPALAASGGAHAVPGWISVGERLPEEGSEVWIAGTRYQTNVTYFDVATLMDGEFLDAEDGNPFINVSYWMPLPAAPTQDQGEGN